jgi:hypothetical protein
VATASSTGSRARNRPSTPSPIHSEPTRRFN